MSLCCVLAGIVSRGRREDFWILAVTSDWSERGSPKNQVQSCGCHFLAVSRVAESATQSQLFPSSPASPPSPLFLSPLLSPPILIQYSPYTPLSWTAPGPYHFLCRTLLVGVTWATDQLSLCGGADMTEAALHYPAPAEPPSPVHRLLHQPAQVAHFQQLPTLPCWN